MKYFIVILLALTALSGCALLESQPATAQLTTQYATLKVIDGDPERADKILSLVAEARQYVDDADNVAIGVLDEAIRSRIRWERLDPADRLLIDAVLQRARERLEFEIGAGVLDAEQRVQLTTFLGWIEDAARALAQY